MITRRISFSSTLSRDECGRRLADATEPDRGGWYEELDRSHVVLARIKGGRVRLRVRRPYVRNFLAPLFYGRLEPASSGTRLSGRFITHPGILAFLVVWFSFLPIVGAAMLRGAGFLLPLLMVVAATGLIWLLWVLGKAERMEIERFICRTLEASVD